MLQINKMRTTAYHHQSDGVIERLNRTVKDVLSKYINVHQNDWDKFVDGVVFAIIVLCMTRQELLRTEWYSGRRCDYPLN